MISTQRAYSLYDAQYINSRVPNAQNIIVDYMETGCWNRLTAVGQDPNPNGARTRINNSRPYGHYTWISKAGSPTTISDIEATPNSDVSLQLNSMAFYCAVVVHNSQNQPGSVADSTARVTGNPSRIENWPARFPEDRPPVLPEQSSKNAASLTGMNTLVESAKITSGSGTISGIKDKTYQTNRDTNSRYVFASPAGFTYRPNSGSSGPQTIRVELQISPIITFHGSEHYCMNPENTRVSSPTDFGPCAPVPISVDFHINVTSLGKAWIQGYKVVHDDNGNHPPATELNSIVSVELYGGPSGTSQTASNSSSYNFGNLKSGSYRVKVNNATAGSLPLGYSLLGYTLCKNSTTCHTGTHKGGSTTLSGEITIPDPLPSNNIYYDLWWHFKYNPPPPPSKNRIYGANKINIWPPEVRDNEQFRIDVSAYIWPDAGIRNRSTDNSTRMWLAGRWGQDSNDIFSSDASNRTNPNSMTSFNTRAEADCPGAGACRQRLPMAYVPENDGAGVGSIPGIKDGSTTPNGNSWLSIRNRNFNASSSSQPTDGGRPTSCASNRRYYRECGGIASNLNSNIGGATGNRINNVEISNIHVRANNLQVDTTDVSLQGKISDAKLQPGFREDDGWNLPAVSQGPKNAAGQYLNTWDNIRNPNPGTPGRLTASPFAPFYANPRFNNPLGFPSNFTYNLNNLNEMKSNYEQNVKLNHIVTATSLLQDGKDPSSPPYSAQSEPLTYTASVREANMDLMWDEYIDWTQVDDKGHWYTTKAQRPTGVSQGPASYSTASLQGFNRGYSQYSHTVDPKPYCTGGHWHYPKKGSPWYHCTSTYDPPPYNVYTQCTGSYSYRTGWYYFWNTRNYYANNSQTRYGWRRTGNLNLQQMPYGKNGQKSLSAFYPNYSTNPGWTNTGSTAFWQDTGRTSMSQAGSTNKPTHANRWIYDTSDPAYNNRQIYSTSVTPSFPVSWTYSYSYSCKYPNGSGTYNSGSQSVGPYYPSAQQLYENSGNGTGGTIHGKYGNAATFDGSSDGQVDVGWAWRSNLQRVRYEQTYADRFRQLGRRAVNGSGEEALYGLESINGLPRPAQAGRDKADITNPTIAVEDADIFAGGRISSYFTSSGAQSAFLFSNGTIQNISSGNSSSYPGYYLNPDKFRVKISPDYSSGSSDAIASVLGPKLDELRAAAARAGTVRSGNQTLSGSFNLGAASERVYLYQGNLTLDNVTFTGGAGTIIVEGNLIITGEVNYPTTPTASSRQDVPSVGFLVTGKNVSPGKIDIRPSVGLVQGSYFANGRVHTGSLLLNDSGNGTSPNNNTTLSDQPFTLNGLVIARSYILARQLGGTANINTKSETFRYDGRIVINPPPGFTAVQNSPSVWNEGVTRD